MSQFAYCCQSFARSVTTAAGCPPLQSPPYTMYNVDPLWLAGYDLLYLELHGLPGEPRWYGDGYVPALSADQIRSISLRGTVAFVACCYLVESPMLQALLDAGAQVIGGSGPNYARSHGIDGADLLGFYFRRWWSIGFRPGAALHLAKTQIQLVRRPSPSIRDALQFRLFEPGRAGEGPPDTPEKPPPHVA